MGVETDRLVTGLTQVARGIGEGADQLGERFAGAMEEMTTTLSDAFEQVLRTNCDKHPDVSLDRVCSTCCDPAPALRIGGLSEIPTDAPAGKLDELCRRIDAWRRLPGFYIGGRLLVDLLDSWREAHDNVRELQADYDRLRRYAIALRSTGQHFQNVLIARVPGHRELHQDWSGLINDAGNPLDTPPRRYSSAPSTTTVDAQNSERAESPVEHSGSILPDPTPPNERQRALTTARSILATARESARREFGDQRDRNLRAGPAPVESLMSAVALLLEAMLTYDEG